ncbi:MAG: hypothetical protein AAF389_06015 [Gemmatimonadota bacterium]
MRSAFALAVLLTLPGQLSGQFLDLGGPIEEADLLYLSGEARQSLEVLERYLAEDSTDVGALWRAARSAVIIGITEDGSRNQNRWLDPAIGWAGRAVELEADNVDGLYWRGVATGRRAMNAAPSYAAQLAQVVYDDAHAILATDPDHGGAHNMLGKLNYEVMALSRVKRLAARTFMGNDALRDMSWENAEHHLSLAAEAWPDYVLFHFDLAQLHRRRDRREEAIESYRRVLALPAVHPVDAGFQDQARAQLAEWGVLPS